MSQLPAQADHRQLMALGFSRTAAKKIARKHNRTRTLAADGRVQVPTDELKRLEPAPAEFAAGGCRWSAANDRSAANFARSAIRGLRPARLCC